MSIPVQPSPTDARHLVFLFLSDSQTGVRIYADNQGTGNRPPLTAGNLMADAVPPNSQTDGDITVAEYPYIFNKANPRPQVIVGSPEAEKQMNTIMTFPPSWYSVETAVPVTICARDMDGNENDYVLTGAAVRSNLVDSVTGIIEGNQHNPDPYGVWSYMHVAGSVKFDVLDDGKTFYSTVLSVGLRRFTQGV